jgi:hypothetical protein
VFGVSVERPTESKSGAHALRAVPASWEIKKPPPADTPPAPREQMLEDESVHTGRTPKPDTEALSSKLQAKERGDRLAKAAIASARGTSRTLLIWGPIVVAVVGALGWAAWANQDALYGLVHKDEPVEAPPVTSTYRLLSEPAGAEVLLDGHKQRGSTPVEVQLIPGVEYRIEVHLDKFATRRALLRATASSVVREMSFRLPRAGSLKVTSEPPGATIELNGFELGVVTPTTLDDVPGGEKLRVTATLKGKAPVTKTITVPEAKSRNLSFEFDK